MLSEKLSDPSQHKRPIFFYFLLLFIFQIKDLFLLLLVGSLNLFKLVWHHFSQPKPLTLSD